jgi:hypothetical protein
MKFKIIISVDTESGALSLEQEDVDGHIATPEDCAVIMQLAIAAMQDQRNLIYGELQ